MRLIINSPILYIQITTQRGCSCTRERQRKALKLVLSIRLLIPTASETQQPWHQILIFPVLIKKKMALLVFLLTYKHKGRNPLLFLLSFEPNSKQCLLGPN